jgi:hypothetical protein
MLRASLLLLAGLPAAAWENVDLSPASTGSFEASSTSLSVNTDVRLEFIVETYCFLRICDNIKAQNAVGGVCGAANGYLSSRSSDNPWYYMMFIFDGIGGPLHTCVEVK